MDAQTKLDLRSYFLDRRYLSSIDEPNIIREYVRYEDVIRLLDDIGYDETEV